LLADYRETFLTAQLLVMFDMGRLGIGQSDGGRLKRPESVIAKLERDSRIRLSRMQDIAGCRLVSENKSEQDEIYARLQTDFDIYRAYDIRENPHSGYRAVHVVIRREDRFVEVQVRTENQRQWARLSEQATAYDSSIKYGGGSEAIRQALDDLSAAYWAYDQAGRTPPPSITQEVETLIARMR
jgi:ppGpp synthetase/RelA/SpoT-type nucleotidyltranferase